MPIKFVYTENGNEKTSLDEHRRRVEILQHNQELIKSFCRESKDKQIIY